MNEGVIQSSFSGEVNNAPESHRAGKAEHLAAASKAKEEAQARRIAEEEAKILVEVEILAREETEYLTKQLEMERRPDKLAVDNEPARLNTVDRDLEKENHPIVSAVNHESFQPEDDVSPRNKSAADDPARDTSNNEFAPGDYLLQLEHFRTVDAVAFHNAVRRVIGLKIMATSGTATGVQLHVKLIEALPLIELLSVAPGVETIITSHDSILITGRSD